ncbi:MAG: aldo/keto reductase [Clostridiales bacterium]|nr:aldo/keto reductase [Clostridiales bacterium]
MGQYGWGQVEEKNLLDAVSAAIDNGINFFDTADTYGLGTSEQTLAKALGSRRKDVIIADKFGVRVEHGHTFYDNSPEWIEHALEGSLKRLNTDYIDLYQIHYRDGKTPLAEVVDKLEELRQKGYIRYYGLSNIHANDLEELQELGADGGGFVSFQDEYSLACRKNEADIRRIQQTLNITPFTWGSLGQGILTGKYDRNSTFGADDRRSREVYVNFHGAKLENRGRHAANRSAAQQAALRRGHPVYYGLYQRFGGALRGENPRPDRGQRDIRGLATGAG